MIALCLCNNMTPSQTQLLLTLGETLSFERRVSPGTKTQNSHTLEQSIVFRTTPPSSLEFNQATLFSFIFAGLKFRENFLRTFRESLISRSRRKIVFAANLISRNRRLSDFIFSFLQKLYVNQQLKQNQYAVP